MEAAILIYNNVQKSIIKRAYFGLIMYTVIVSLLSALTTETLKVSTENFEERMLDKCQHLSWLYLLFPLIGFFIIFLFRKFAFNNKANKGFKEIYATLENRSNELPAFKIFSHYINGFTTVIFGGSTGIEVSTVVATAAIGATAYRKTSIARKYKTEIIAAAVAAGITTLFCSPLAGMFFAMEAIARKTSKTILLTTALSALISWLFIYLLSVKPMFSMHPEAWEYHTLPFLLALGVAAGFLSVYFTKACLFIKKQFARITNDYLRITLGAAIVGSSLLVLPQLYGDGYHVISALLTGAQNVQFSLSFISLLIGLIVMKPLIASVTLGAGGDGGVFAPSLIIGAFFGLAFALAINHYFGTHLIPINFMIVGMAAVLSGSIHAPFTAIALLISMSGSTILFVPIAIGCFAAKYVAKTLYKYTVYTYHE